MFVNSNAIPSQSPFYQFKQTRSVSIFDSPDHPNGSPSEPVSICIHKSVVTKMKYSTNVFIYLTVDSVTDHPTNALDTLKPIVCRVYKIKNMN